ncbi:hypothetical protein [Streptomyces sp. NPDC003077]|uniref:hypothetical protein n=1 Tax=Streptomyces sp. NPDC003077 TaxID=3154443 RepID=UPI0033BD705F
MPPSIELHHTRDAAPDHWPDDRTVAVAMERDGESVTGSVALIDLGAEDPDLRFVALPEGTGETLAPLMRAAARVAREAGGTVLRWVAETDGTEPQAVAELGARQGDEVYRWWRRDLPAAHLPAAGPAVSELPAPDGTAFRLGLDDALFDVEVDDRTAILTHNREQEGTTAELTELTAAVVGKVSAEHPGVRTAQTPTDPHDDTFHAALTACGFSPTERRAVEYHLPLTAQA